jgi:hypothetical protein
VDKAPTDINIGKGLASKAAVTRANTPPGTTANGNTGVCERNDANAYRFSQCRGSDMNMLRTDLGSVKRLRHSFARYFSTA